MCGLTVIVLGAGIALGSERDREKKTCPREPDKFLDVQRRAAGQDAEAQSQLASCYELGRNVKPSRAETIHWLSLAAQQGYAPAEYELGRIYLYGRGIPADYKLAIQWEEKAALQGEVKAQRDMAYIYERGLGVQPSPADAVLWNRRAAQQGDAQAQLHLAEALEKGMGTPISPEEAKQWYLKAAKQNVAQAQLHLAQIYERDDQRCGAALGWYRKAAENAEVAAMYELGRLYKTACGRDLARAFIWFEIGARFGSQESRAEADKLSHLLSEIQRRKAKATVEEWISRHSGAQKEEDED